MGAIDVSAHRERQLDLNLEMLSDAPLIRKGISQSSAEGEIIYRPDGVPELALGEYKFPMPSAEEIRSIISNIPKDHVVLIYGWGTGRFAQAVRRYLGRDILVYDPNFGLLRTVLEQDNSTLHRFHPCCNENEFRVQWVRIASGQTQWTMLQHPGYDECFPGQKSELEGYLQSLIVSITITKNTYRIRGRDWIKNTIRTSKLLASNPTLGAEKNAFKGIPAFIIGAGPSLDKNIHLIGDAIKKGIVITTNSGARALRQHGFKPQFLACIESIDISDKLKETQLLDESICAFSMTGAPEHWDVAGSKKFVIYEGIDGISKPLKELTQSSGLDVSGSVSTAATSLAYRMGCSPIVLVGQDLAYTDGKTYAGGTGYESSSASFNEANNQIDLSWNDTIQEAHRKTGSDRHHSEPSIIVPAWGGSGTVLSGYSMVPVAKWFEQFSASCSIRMLDTDLINATEGGSHIEGWSDVALEELLSNLTIVDLSAEKVHAKLKEQSKNISNEDIATWLNHELKKLSRCRRAARAVINATEIALRGFQADNYKVISSAFRSLDKFESKLRSELIESPLLSGWLQKEANDAYDDAQLRIGNTQETSSEREQALSSIHQVSHLAHSIMSASNQLQLLINEQLISLDGFPDPSSTTQTEE